MSEGRVGTRSHDEYAREHETGDDSLPVRRTIVIRGQVADRHYGSRRSVRTVQERAIARPDRVAMWAVMLGLLLVIVAATSGHA